MRAWLAVIGSEWALIVLAVSVVTAVAPQRDGLAGLAEVGAPFLILSLLPFVPLAVARLTDRSAAARRSQASIRLLLTALLAVAVVRFGPAWVSPPANDPGGQQFGVTSWNLESGEADPAALLEQLRQAPIGIVALIELARVYPDVIRADAAIAARFPYQLFFPGDGSIGMGLLSSHPVLDSGRIAEDPALLWARLDLGAGRTVVVVTAHPAAADWRTLGALPIPVDYDVTRRDEQLRTIRMTVDQMLAGGEPFVMAGDFNVTDREPAYVNLSAGLLDAHHEVGLGPGSTWRPDPIKWLPLGVIRIDMAFSANGARPVSMSADCTPRGSDHCLIRASMALP